MSNLYMSYGHGGTDPGAVNGARKEKDYALKTGQAVSKHLRQAGHTVLEHRTIDTDYGLNAAGRINDVVKKANTSGADFMLDIHYNAGGGRGTECYHSVNGEGKEMATAICNQLSALGFVNRGAKTKTGSKGDYFGVIRSTKMPALLVECAFIDTSTDVDLVEKLGFDSIGKAVAQGICQVLGGSMKDDAGKSPTDSGDITSPSREPVVSKKDLIQTLQAELNKQFKRGLKVDGIFGPKTKAACVSVRKGAKGNITKVLQQALQLHGHKLDADGLFGTKTQQQVRGFQQAKGLKVDGVAGAGMFEKLLK